MAGPAQSSLAVLQQAVAVEAPGIQAAAIVTVVSIT